MEDFLLSFVCTKCRCCCRAGWKQTRLRTAVTTAATQGEAQRQNVFLFIFIQVSLVCSIKEHAIKYKIQDFSLYLSASFLLSDRDAKKHCKYAPQKETLLKRKSHRSRRLQASEAECHEFRSEPHRTCFDVPYEIFPLLISFVFTF